MSGTQLGSAVHYAGCGYCTAGDGLYHQAALGFSDGLRFSGKWDVVRTAPEPHEMYGYFLRNQTVPLGPGQRITGWEAHCACMRDPDGGKCTNATFPPEIYEDDFTASQALALLRRKPLGKPWFLQVPVPSLPDAPPEALAQGPGKY